MKFLLLLFAVVSVFFLLKKSSGKSQSPGSTSELAPGRDYAPDTGEVYEDQAPRYSGLSDWEKDLEPLWTGSLLVEFTYKARGKDRERRKVELHDVLMDGHGRIYFRGHCQSREEQRTFNIEGILTKVLCSGKRYDVDDFLYERLGLEV